MILAIDIGNTNIVAGVFDGKNLLAHWRMETAKERTSDEYGITLLSFLAHAGIKKEEIKGACVGCVVPQLKDTFARMIRDYVKVKPLLVEPGVKTGMPILTDNPKEVGADRIITSVAAYTANKCALIVVDFGTAITFDCVNEKGEYTGGAIAPGMQVSTEALFNKAAKIAKVEISRPASAIGKNTVESLKSGVLYGFAGLVDGVVEKIKKEFKVKPEKVIATGGYAHIIAKESTSITELDEFLVLKGLRIIYEVNS